VYLRLPQSTGYLVLLAYNVYPYLVVYLAPLLALILSTRFSISTLLQILTSSCKPVTATITAAVLPVEVITEGLLAVVKAEEGMTVISTGGTDHNTVVGRGQLGRQEGTESSQSA
jgi:hypothetical protein